MFFDHSYFQLGINSSAAQDRFLLKRGLSRAIFRKNMQQLFMVPSSKFLLLQEGQQINFFPYIIQMVSECSSSIVGSRNIK